MIKVQQQDFDLAAEIAALTRGRTDIGGVVSFTGLVRDVSDGAKVAARGSDDAAAERWKG